MRGVHREDPGIRPHLPVAATKDFARSTRPGAADGARIAREIAGGPNVFERRLLLLSWLQEQLDHSDVRLTRSTYGKSFKLRDLAAADRQGTRSRLVVTKMVTEAGNAD